MKKISKASQAAKKASQTRSMRNQALAAIEDRFGYETREVLESLLKGRDPNWLYGSSIAAYKANLTRGTYDQCLNGVTF